MPYRPVFTARLLGLECLTNNQNVVTYQSNVTSRRKAAVKPGMSAPLLSLVTPQRRDNAKRAITHQTDQKYRCSTQDQTPGRFTVTTGATNGHTPKSQAAPNGQPG